MQLFLEVVADGFAFAIRIGREVDCVHLLGGGLQLRDELLLAFDDFVVGFEIMIDIDREIVLGEILNMTERSFDDVICLPRYLLMVFAFAGDSTITRAFGIGDFRNAAPSAA